MPAMPMSYLVKYTPFILTHVVQSQGQCLQFESKRHISGQLSLVALTTPMAAATMARTKTKRIVREDVMLVLGAQINLKMGRRNFKWCILFFM
jgi:hypothetical protein